MKHARNPGHGSLVLVPPATILLALMVLAAVPVSEAMATFDMTGFNFLPIDKKYCSPWANCGVYDSNQYTCLDGVLCPLGYSRCGSGDDYACYLDAADAPGVTPAYSCHNNEIVQTLFDGPSDGSQVTNCVDYSKAVLDAGKWDKDRLKQIVRALRTKNCTPWSNCGSKLAYDTEAYDCLNGVLCPKSYSRCGVSPKTFKCFQMQADEGNTNKATQSCVQNELVPVPGIDDDTAYTRCEEDYVPCDPFDTCGDHDESQFSCYADVLGMKGFCRCGQDAVGMSYVKPRGVQKTNVCIQGMVQPVSQANPENDGSEVCFCKKSTDLEFAKKITVDKKCPLWTNCPGLWDRDSYDCLNGQICPTGFSLCGTSCYEKGGVYSCHAGKLVTPANDDDDSQIDRCYVGPTCNNGKTPWDNCGSSWDRDAYECLNGALCPSGWQKCGDDKAYVCFNPGGKSPASCIDGKLETSGCRGQSDETVIKKCAPSGTTIQPAVTKSQPSCPGSVLYTNCEDGTIDLSTHSCLDGFACPIGMARCGNSHTNYACYTVGGTHSCKNHKLKSGANKDDGTQVTACEPPENDLCHPWTNCASDFDPDVHSCLDGVLCPHGFSRCTNPDNGVYACFDPNADPAYGCKNGNVVQLKDEQQSDSTEIKYCANNELQLLKLIIREDIIFKITSSFCGNAEPWTNCAGEYSTDDYWCLNGQLCPAGAWRCGPPSSFSCYVPGTTYSCVNNALQLGPNHDDATAVGPCQTAAIEYCAPWTNCGDYDNTQFTCLDGKLCPIGDSRCPTNFDEGYVCYNPTADFSCAYGPPITACSNAQDTMAENLLCNGDFETVQRNIVGSAFSTIFATDSTTLPCWVVTPNGVSTNPGSVDLINGYWVSHSGTRSLDMAGNSNGEIKQTFATTPGAYYDVTFYLAKNPDLGPEDKFIHVLAPGKDVPFTCTLKTKDGITRTKDNMLFEKQTVTFLATAEQSTLTFSEQDANDGGFTGCALDLVSVVVSDQSKVKGIPARPTVTTPTCTNNELAWDNCPGVWDTTAYWCLNGNLCPAGMHSCGLLGSYSCYNPKTQSCAANVLVNTPGFDDQTAVGYCAPATPCVPWSNCGLPDVDYDTKAYVCLNGRLCPAGQIACGSGYEFACYDPNAKPALVCIQGSLIPFQNDISDGSEITICQNIPDIPAGFSYQRNADYDSVALTAAGASQTCGNKGVAGRTADQCAALCASTTGCIMFQLTGQATSATSDDCCYLRSAATGYSFTAGVDTYFMPVLPYLKKDFAFNDITAAPFNEATCFSAGKVLTNKLQCEEACLATKSCVGFSFGNNGVRAGCCWLKSAATGEAATNNDVDFYRLFRGAVVPPANIANLPVAQRCTPWTNCPSEMFPASAACLDGQMCPAGYEKCGGASFGSNSYHCFLPSSFSMSGGAVKAFSCRQNTLMMTAVASSDATPVDFCRSQASQQCVPWTNCEPFDAKAYACMDGLACQIGQLKCQKDCYNPTQFGCSPTGLTPDLSKNNPLSSVGPCQRGQIIVQAPTSPVCAPGTTPWTNCAPASGNYWCINGQNCLAGFNRCGTACYDPNAYGCQNGELVQPDEFGSIVSDGSQTIPCGDQKEILLLKLLEKPPSVDVTCTDTLWTNCVQQYDAKTYWCLNGQICPRGLYLCGTSCYDPTKYGCKKGVLSGMGDTTSDGTEVVPCLSATTQLKITIRKQGGDSFSAADHQAIVTALSNHAGAGDKTAVSVALLTLEIGGTMDIAKVGVPLSVWEDRCLALLRAELKAIADSVGADFSIDPIGLAALAPAGSPARRRALLQAVTNSTGSSLTIQFSIQSSNQTEAGPLAMQLQGALSPGGVFVNALAAGGISITNVTVAPNVTGANVMATVTLPVKSTDEAKALVATLTQLAASGALDSELKTLGLSGTIGTNAQFSILSLTPGTGSNITTAPGPAPVPAPALAPAPAPTTTDKKSAAAGLRVDVASVASAAVAIALVGAVVGLF
ncbi:hypothetical protein KFL_001130170 [Klebsormidium nitens]|uniref:DUF642 domain-containing protein n=1 Tax=Klebsormidium nitens TaxID=105231 RepID=A0A0U9HS27_KLENI|nr:hypothetical protein KFL_001130170 [Klebsormidium nitens]|eukprot:GAQ82498.1 hypothetical protein KFL_001130170 [Klebsormidium nitens]